jgi:hypothetical protein
MHGSMCISTNNFVDKNRMDYFQEASWSLHRRRNDQQVGLALSSMFMSRIWNLVFLLLISYQLQLIDTMLID